MHSLASSRVEIDLVIMLGSSGSEFPEGWIDAAREGIARDTVEKALSLEGIRRVVVGTNRQSFIEALAGLPVDVVRDRPDIPFHFGKQLLAVIEAVGLERILYVGGGAAPLLSVAQLQALLDALAEAPNRLVTNNLYSSDIVGFSASWLSGIGLPSRDNDLAWSLAQLGGLDVRQPPRSAGTSFDVDTITDVMILKLCPALGLHTANAIAEMPLDTNRLQAVLQRLRDPEATLMLIGRASSDVWHTLQERVRCAIRVIAEERGMRASGRLARHEVRSLVGIYMQKYGAEAFFELLSHLADAALIDSRVLLAHFGPWPSDSDRAYSDLMMPGEITDVVTRRLTAAAANAPIPIVLSGHSLMSGGMLALLEAIGL
jgi:hypothetical protein